MLLDEAFAGIDPRNRGHCMKLIADFDLDFVMTSDRERGCYPALAGNAIYHLSTEPGNSAVLCTRQVWNGHEELAADDHGPAHAEDEPEDDEEDEEDDGGLFAAEEDAEDGPHGKDA